MKYARDAKPSLLNEQTAQVLFETLPWIKNLTGKVVVIKYGGAAMVDAKLRDDVMSDIVLLKIMGMRPVIVHGGGKAINEAFSHYDLPVEFKNGQRVTTPEAMDIVREVLGGKVTLLWAYRAATPERLSHPRLTPSSSAWARLRA